MVVYYCYYLKLVPIIRFTYTYIEYTYAVKYLIPITYTQ